MGIGEKIKSKWVKSLKIWGSIYFLTCRAEAGTGDGRAGAHSVACSQRVAACSSGGEKFMSHLSELHTAQRFDCVVIVS
jgi:hypothetical protein